MVATIMKRVLSIIIALVGISCIPINQMEYSISKEKIEEYRQHPVKNIQLLSIINDNDEFISLKGNPDISHATLEHHILNEITRDDSKTYIVFEYFSLEGITCNIKAVTISDKNNLLSIIRLAEYEEYPDGELNESTIIESDIATRTTIVYGLQEYNDSLDLIIMKRDTTIMTYKLNRFNKIELVDSIFKHYESVE